MKNHIVFAVALFFVSFAASSAEEIKLWISTSAQQNVFKRIKEPFEKETGIKINGLDNKGTSAVIYLVDTINGKVEASTSSLRWEDWVDLVKKEHPEITDAQFKELTQRVIGHDVFNVIAHPGIGLKKLELIQLEGLFSGRIRNWKQIGGADVPVKIVYPKSRSATVVAFQKIITGGQAFGGDVIDVSDYSDVLEKVEKTPGSVGFGPTETKSEKTLLLETPNLGRPLLLVTKGRPNPKVQKLLDFIEKNRVKK